MIGNETIGLFIKQIMTSLKNWSADDVEQTISNLLESGIIYTTIDEHHYKYCSTPKVTSMTNK